MIHTSKRKRTSLKSCSFYERVCGDLLVGCSALATPIQDNISNGCYSRETKEAEHKARSEDDLPNNSNILQSLSYDSIKAPPIKFKYTRRYKSLCSSDKRHYVAANHLIPEASERVSEMNAVQPDLYNIGCISCQSKLSHFDQNHDISGRERGPCSGDSYLLQNSMTSMINIWVHWRMLDLYVMNHIHIIIVLILLQMMLGNLTRDRLTLINVAVQVSLIKYLTRKKMKLVDVAQIYLSREVLNQNVRVLMYCTNQIIRVAMEQMAEVGKLVTSLWKPSGLHLRLPIVEGPGRMRILVCWTPHTYRHAKIYRAE